MRKAVERFCGGYAGAPDADIRDRWKAAPPDVQAAWLEALEKESGDET